MKNLLSKKVLVWASFAALLAVLLWLGVMVVSYWPAQFQHARISIETADGRSVPYSVELAITPHEHEYGLMFRSSLPKQSGMLFLFNHDFDSATKGVAFWMKNTRISLDMLFVGDDGRITGIHPNAKPYDLTPISSPGPVKAVIEINGGEAENLGIKTGDKVIYPGLASQ